MMMFATLIAAIIAVATRHAAARYALSDYAIARIERAPSARWHTMRYGAGVRQVERVR